MPDGLQQLSRVGPESRTKKMGNRCWPVMSETDSDKAYIVIYVEKFGGQFRQKFWLCTCPHYIMGCLEAGVQCKHIQWVLDKTGMRF